MKDLGAGNSGGSQAAKAPPEGTTEGVEQASEGHGKYVSHGGGSPTGATGLGSFNGGLVGLILRVILVLGVLYTGWGMGRIANAILQLNSTIASTSSKACGAS